MRGQHRFYGPIATVALAAAAAPAAVEAQQASTASVRGSVMLEEELAEGISIIATHSTSGFTTGTTSRADGTYVLDALPPGTYRINASGSDAGRTVQLITLRGGQNVLLNLTLDTDPQLNVGAPNLVSTRDDRGYEIATKVSPTLIAALPRLNRNFLSFAELAVAQTVAPGDVYVDGTSQGINPGVNGLGSSRGSLFPLVAIADYRVITQNFKAEHEQPSGALVTTLTRSGGNEFHGEVFADRTAKTFGAATQNDYGFWLGGPIVHDRMHWLLAYEGRDLSAAPSTPREDLLFSKIDWSPDDFNLVELSLKLRQEDGQRDQARGDLRYQRSGETWVNDAHLSVDTATLDARDQSRIDARAVALQNDFTYSGVDWSGNHVFKAGLKARSLSFDGANGLDGASSENRYGVYAQDDWDLNNNLTLNLGVRYDHDDRPGFDEAWQPRLGLAFDLDADQRHVLFAGYGRGPERNPIDDRLSLGMRNRVGIWNTELAVSRHSGYSLSLKADKPFTGLSGWGAGVAYVYTDTREAQALNARVASDFAIDTWQNAVGVGHHRLVASIVRNASYGIVYALRLNLATAALRAADDACTACRNSSYRQLDLAVSKPIRFPSGTLRVRADLINLLDARNDNGGVAGPSRTLALGVSYAW